MQNVNAAFHALVKVAQYAASAPCECIFGTLDNGDYGRYHVCAACIAFTALVSAENELGLGNELSQRKDGDDWRLDV